MDNTCHIATYSSCVACKDCGIPHTRDTLLRTLRGRAVYLIDNKQTFNIPGSGEKNVLSPILLPGLPPPLYTDVFFEIHIHNKQRCDKNVDTWPVSVYYKLKKTVNRSRFPTHST